MKLSKDGWTGLAVLAASLVLFGLTLDLKPSPLVPIGPGFYPRLVLGLTALLAALLVAGDLVRRAPARGAPSANYGAVALHFAVFALYALALPGLGFRLATFLYVVATNALLAPPRGLRQWLRPLVLGVATALITYFVFERYLSVLLPRGRWTDF